MGWVNFGEKIRSESRVRGRVSYNAKNQYCHRHYRSSFS